MNAMTEWPADDAPITEWLMPVSALLINRREITASSGIEPSARMRPGKSAALQARIQRRAQRKQCPATDAKICKLALQGQSCTAISRYLDVSDGHVLRVIKREGIYDQWREARDG